jgi:hypothetical protein
MEYKPLLREDALRLMTNIETPTKLVSSSGVSCKEIGQLHAGLRLCLLIETINGRPRWSDSPTDTLLFQRLASEANNGIL